MNNIEPSASVAGPSDPGEKSASARSKNRESIWLVALGGIVIYLMDAKAFNTYFFGENFIYLQFYINHGTHFWRAFFSPFYGIFYRPVVFAFDLPWQLFLPPQPLAFHVRNFGIVLLELALLHRILCRITASPTARIFGCSFFILSKIHLTLVGYINTIDSLVLSTLMLLAVLFFIRFVQERKWKDYWLGTGFCLLSDFSKDYGLVINSVVAVIVLAYGIDWRNWSRDVRWWIWRLIPLVFSAAIYLGIRSAVLGDGTAQSAPSYAPHFSLIAAVGKILRFGTTLCNASWVDDGSNGSSGFPIWWATIVHSNNLPQITLAYCLVCSAALVSFAWKGRRAGMTLLLPLAWCAAYLGPTLLVQSVNIYYHWEPMIAIAVLLALLANAAGSKFTYAIGVPLLAAIGASGFLSHQDMQYHWSFIASRTAPLKQNVVEKYRGIQLTGITFVSRSDQIDFWQYSLANPMMQRLTDRPNLQVRYAPYADVSHNRVFADQTNLLLDADDGFAPLQPGAQVGPDLGKQSGPTLLISVAPDSTRAGHPFNQQPNMVSAISVTCINASSKSVLVWNETPLQTAYGNSGWLTALVPKELYQIPGTYQISIATGGVSSNKFPFVVRP